jgi:hypothetical protein
VRGLGIDRHPELKQEYFRNYRKVVYLAQIRSAALLDEARRIACNLGLEFEHRHTGYGELGTHLAALVAADRTSSWQR